MCCGEETEGKGGRRRGRRGREGVGGGEGEGKGWGGGIRGGVDQMDSDVSTVCLG